jgi:hypothetical protein
MTIICGVVRGAIYRHTIEYELVLPNAANRKRCHHHNYRNGDAIVAEDRPSRRENKIMR